jgi:two-component system cell cycle response regulator
MGDTGDKNLKSDERRILIVDDDSDMLTNMKYILKAFHVETVSYPLEALEKIKNAEFSVVLSDYQMPTMNGVEFLKKCAEIKPNCKRVLVTAFVDLMQSEELWNQAKVHRVLAKPFTAEELIDVVENALFESVMEEENNKLRKLALTDSLTGLANQRYFWDCLRAEFSRSNRFGRPMTVLLFDVDNFKQINDSRGHLEGDGVLKKIAETIKNETRQMDITARYGGDEFAVILPEIEYEGAYTIAKRLRDRVLNETGISLSGGMASSPPCTSERDLVSHADSLLMGAKKAAKGQIFK